MLITLHTLFYHVDPRPRHSLALAGVVLCALFLL